MVYFKFKSKVQVPRCKVQDPRSKVQVSSAKFQVPRSKFQVPRSKFQVPSSKFKFKLKAVSEYIGSDTIQCSVSDIGSDTSMTILSG